MVREAHGPDETAKLYIVEKAYCIVFWNNFFKLQYEILHIILKMLKH